MCLLVRLRFVISGPVLSVSFLRDSNTLRHDGLAVARLFALDRVFDCEDMFAAKLARFKVWTGAMRCLRIRIDRVQFIAEGS